MVKKERFFSRAAKLTGEVGLPKKPRTLEGNDENVIVQLD
jgi:hypothetical protein